MAQIIWRPGPGVSMKYDSQILADAGMANSKACGGEGDKGCSGLRKKRPSDSKKK